MGIWELLVLAVGLSMDAFAVAVCKGLSMGRFSLKKAAVVGGYFGFFQAAMPLVGYLLGVSFKGYITAVDHWIAFALLTLIGGNMVREALSKGEDEQDARLDLKAMLPLAVATSIDALAIGVTFAFLQVNIVPAVSFIGATTFLLSIGGVAVGSFFGAKYQKKAELAGGIILICLGIKLLVEHLIGG